MLRARIILKPSPQPRSVGNCLPRNQSLVPKMLGTAALVSPVVSEIVVVQGRRVAFHKSRSWASNSWKVKDLCDNVHPSQT